MEIRNLTWQLHEITLSSNTKITKTEKEIKSKL